MTFTALSASDVVADWCGCLATRSVSNLSQTTHRVRAPVLLYPLLSRESGDEHCHNRATVPIINLNMPPKRKAAPATTSESNATTGGNDIVNTAASNRTKRNIAAVPPEEKSINKRPTKSQGKGKSKLFITTVQTQMLIKSDDLRLCRFSIALR